MMKKRVLTSLMLCLAIFMLAGCGNGYDKKIVGFWVRDDGSMSYEFTAEGEVIVEDYEVDYRIRGDYRIVDTTLETKEKAKTWSNAQKDVISFDGDDVLIFHDIYDLGDEQIKDIRYLRQKTTTE